MGRALQNGEMNIWAGAGRLARTKTSQAEFSHRAAACVNMIANFELQISTHSEFQNHVIRSLFSIRNLQSAIRNPIVFPNKNAVFSRFLVATCGPV
jgi:hypothetical protein